MGASRHTASAPPPPPPGREPSPISSPTLKLAPLIHTLVALDTFFRQHSGDLDFLRHQDRSHRTVEHGRHDIGHVAGGVVFSPGPEVGVVRTPGGLFPLGFGRQAFALPGAVGLGFIPIHIVDGMVISGVVVGSRTAAGAAISFLADRNISATPFLPEMNASNYLKTCDVNIVMVGTSENSRTFAFALTEAAKKSGIPSIGFVDGPANAEHRFRGISTEPLLHAPDWLILTDQDTANRFRDLRHPEERLVVTGHPYYDKLLTEAAALRTMSTSEHRQIAIPNAPIEGPVIVFLGESSDGLGMDIKRKSPSYTLCGRSGSQRRGRSSASHAASA